MRYTSSAGMKVGAVIGIEAQSSLQASGHRGLKGFCISLAFHALAVVFAFVGSAPFRTDSPDLYAKDDPQPVERKIIWYPLREMRALSPTHRIGTAPVAQGDEKKNLVAIHQDPKSKTGKQAILRPDGAKPIEQEIPSPNLVAIETPPEPAKPRKAFRLPDPPPAQRVQPELNAPVATAASAQTSIAAPLELAAMPKATRRFVAPPAPAPAKTGEAMPPAPAPLLPQLPQTGIATPNELSSMPKVTRRFVAPPAPSQSSAPKLRPEDIVAPPTVQPGGARAAQEFNQRALASVLSSGSGPPRLRFVPPPAQSGGRGSGTARPLEGAAPPAPASVSAAVLNTAPLDKILASIPDGARPVQMSAAPVVGAPSSGPVKSNSLQMAGVAVSGPAAETGASPAPSPTPAPGPKATIYQETRNSVRRNTLSAPLRPSSRIIPQLIESRFHDRIAYSMILMRPQLPLYAGDWVLWFAERSPKPGGAVQMRAPQPLRKMAAVADSGDTGLGGRFQFAGTILRNGQLDGVVVLSGSDKADSKAAAIKDLESWQFAPALRDGEAIDVEVVLEVQFQSGNSPAGYGTPRH